MERGDINGDGHITPGDALCAFWRSITGEFEPECQFEHSEEVADANCDGSVTPADALCIFWKAVEGEWPDECQCLTAKIAIRTPMVDQVQVGSAVGNPDEIVKVPISVVNPQGLNAFALQLNYPGEFLAFQSFSATAATDDWVAIEGIQTVDGIIHIGGFDPEGITSDGSVNIAEVTFTVQKGAEGGGQFTLTGLMDDLSGVEVKEGNFNIREIPTSYSLEQNYPNPFNPTTTIQYSVISDQSPPHVTLKIYNISGQEVRTLVDDIQESGYYTVTRDGRNRTGTLLPSGFYFYRLEADNFVRTRRMVLLK